MISGERIRLVRELRGMTQENLAGQVGVTQSAIAQAESGLISVTDEVAEKIAFKTGFPLSFFKRQGMPDFPLGSLLFRAHNSLTAAEKAEAHRYGHVIFEMVEQMRSGHEIPLRLPRLDLNDPARAAQITRSHFGLSPDTPIRNLTNEIEKAGVFVFALPISMNGFDAFSLWAGSEPHRPVVVLCGDKPGDRFRMSIAHELGHLVLHQAVRGDLKDVERAAARFAGELLLPEVAMRRELIPPITLTRLVAMKPKWKVAIQALIVRAHELNLISDNQYKYLFQQLSARGWRKQEPGAFPPEKPRAVRKIAEILYGNPIDLRRLAAESNLAPQFVREVIEAHAEKTVARAVQGKPVNSARRPIAIIKHSTTK
jgi:Zn-dependent peptidase ImmA (M78 family)/DNA-binding XRE family transcriptional regulator